MCGGKPKTDNSAAIKAEKDEQARQQRIRQGQGAIDSAFSQYNNDYFDNYAKSYNEYYMPQLDSQYNDAVDELTATLARRGTLESSAGAAQMAKLAENLSREKTNIASQATNSVNDLRSRVEGSRSDLYGLNQSSADPAAMGARAQAQAATYMQPPAFSPLGQVFADSLNPALGAFSANQNSANPSTFKDIGLSLAGGKNSSGRKINN